MKNVQSFLIPNASIETATSEESVNH